MKGEAIKALVAQLGTDKEPSDADTLAAIGEAVDVVIGVADALNRLATAAERLAKAVDDTGELNVYARNADA